ncbi:hypothetical protein TWF730_001951 [Orbilia blumenaviensis]|uniref:Uncharacterized protein n=1 Tax=Orbilia blumenaviensis TaxID=1796055 RepID=A0AAV9UCJ1_9PEZI
MTDTTNIDTNPPTPQPQAQPSQPTAMTPKNMEILATVLQYATIDITNVPFDIIAQKLGYKNAETAKKRYQQVKQKVSDAAVVGGGDAGGGDQVGLIGDAGVAKKGKRGRKPKEGGEKKGGEKNEGDKKGRGRKKKVKVEEEGEGVKEEERVEAVVEEENMKAVD